MIFIYCEIIFSIIFILHIQMEIGAINLKNVTKEDLINNLIEGKYIVPSKEEKTLIQEKINSSVTSGNYIIARNALILGIFFDSEKTFLNIRKKGLFRYSNYILRKCIVFKLAEEVLDICKKIGYDSYINITYLKSVINLSVFLELYITYRKFIISEIKMFEIKFKDKSLIKTLLAFVEYLFFSNHIVAKVINPLEITSRSKEEISSAVSYLIYFITDFKGWNISDTEKISEKYIFDGDINQLVITACLISDLKEFEILIEHFGYECIIQNNNIKIIPPSDNFEKSIRLGYIKSEIQEINDFKECKDVISFNDLVNSVSEKLNDDGLQILYYKKDLDYPRYIVGFPEPILDIIIEKFFKPDWLFKEEIEYLSHVFKEQLLDYEKLINTEINDNFTLFDFIKIKRIFVFFGLLFKKEIRRKNITDKADLIKSLIPSYLTGDLYNLMLKFIPEPHIDSFLNVISWKPNMDVLFDLQYRPIVLLNNVFMIPFFILINSNSIRNLFASEYKLDNKNLFTNGLYDAVVTKLEDSFLEAGIPSYKQVSIPNGDIDLFTIYENTLFLFECKQSLHPTSNYDLRTTYDYIRKAEKQLDYLNQEFKNGNLIDILEAKFEIDLKKITNVVSCIVLSNRLFNGNAFKYPIRYLFEIDNFLNEGTMRTNDGTYSLWKGKQLCLDDLLEFFSEKSKFVKLMFDSLSVRTLTYKQTMPKIEFDSYYMDIERANFLVKEFTSKLRKVK